MTYVRKSRRFIVNTMNKREFQNISDRVVTSLKEERIRQGISPYRMAMDTGLSKNSVLNIERLIQKPALYTVMMIANYLKADLSEIIKKANS